MPGDGNPLAWLWGGGSGEEEKESSASHSRPTSNSTQEWGLSLPQLHSLTGLEWWGKSEEREESIPEDAVLKVFSEHGGEEWRPNVPTREFENDSHMKVVGNQQMVPNDSAVEGNYEPDEYGQLEEDDEDYDEEEEEIEFSNLVDGNGNRLPMFSNEFWAFKQDEYLYLHHELPGEQMTEASVLPRENIFFRAPRETPGWRPGGRFLYHAHSQSSIEDMQEREQYAARKARAKARQVHEHQKAVLLEREKKLTRGAEPKRFLKLAEDARFIRQTEMDRHADAKDRDSHGAQAPSRQQLQEESRVQMELDLEDWRVGKGKRVPGVAEIAAERKRVLWKLRTERPENPLVKDALRNDGEMH